VTQVLEHVATTPKRDGPKVVAPSARTRVGPADAHELFTVSERRSQPLQAKLVVGRSDDPAEHAAERVAAHVLRMPDPTHTGRAIAHEPEPTRDSPTIQCKSVHTASVPGGEAPVPRSEAAVQAAVRGGAFLSGDVRVFFETRMGHDFSDVRVHTDGAADAAARAVQASAYTVGRDVVFAAGQYAPDTRDGRRLLAHELTHVVQQRRAPVRSVQRKLAVGAGLSMDTKGFTTSKSGDEYTCPAIVKNSVWNELFTSLLFSPRVFKIAGTTKAAIDANLEKHMTARHDIAAFAAKKKYTFAAGAGFKMNPAYWIVDATGWRLKPGVAQDEAINDLNVHPTEYAIACLAATKLTMLSPGSPLSDDNGVAPDDWIPGDWGYITNTKFPAGWTPGLEGENIIYTGKAKFWGHFGPGIEYKLLTEWFDQVKSWHGGAQIETYRTRPTIGLL
jgi:Domain of unknown function (DUF4157)/Protein-glutamine gamma-glutamyltransferase